MKCPNCKSGYCEYLEKRQRVSAGSTRSWKPRTDFTAFCKACNWKGVI